MEDGINATYCKATTRIHLITTLYSRTLPYCICNTDASPEAELGAEGRVKNNVIVT